MSGLEQKAMYCYDNKLVKEQRKKCNEDKCKKWHGVDSDNLVWCDDWRIGNCASYNQEDGVPYGEQWVRLMDAEEEIKRVDDKLQGKLAKAILKYQGYKKKIAKLKEKADYYNKMYGKLASERDSLKDRLGQIREHTKKLGEILDGQAVWLEMPMTRKVINWREELVGLLGQNTGKPEPKKEEKPK